MPGLFHSPEPYAGQVYKDLKNDCKATGQLFVDMEFPASYNSLFRRGAKKIQGIEWKRPKDLSSDPKLFVEGTSSGDVTQGQLGNCWFVAATSCLAIHKSLWKKIIPDPDDQEWDANRPDDYRGIFHFRFWRHGVWVDVVIDDQLPTVNGQLIFVHSQSRNEYWSALLEKAYAKLFGCYEALDGGGLEEALVDFTGGIAETIELQKDINYTADAQKRFELYEVLRQAVSHKALMAAAIPAESQAEMEAQTDMGLVKGHAYGITQVCKVALAGTGLFNTFNQEKIPMIRLRNPWGKHEWNGRFADGSAEWEKITKSDREKIGLTYEDDGEFWMHFEDFCQYFVTVSVCRVVNKSIFTTEKTWVEAKLHAAWVPPMLAGGCSNNRETFLKNPQLAFSVTKKEDDVLLSLEQKIVHREKPKETIGFHILKVEENRTTRMHEPQSIIKSSPFKNSRSVFIRATLNKGRYVIIPCTFEPGKQLEFLLRVYTDVDMKAKQLTKESPGKIGGFCGLCGKASVIAVRVRFVKASGLEKQDRDSGGADPYIIARCEKETVRIPTEENTLNPEWDRSALFFKTDDSSPIDIEIWNKNPIKDQFMGQTSILANEECENKAMQLPLRGRKIDDPQPPGSLIVAYTVRRDVDSF